VVLYILPRLFGISLLFFLALPTTADDLSLLFLRLTLAAAATKSDTQCLPCHCNGLGQSIEFTLFSIRGCCIYKQVPYKKELSWDGVTDHHEDLVSLLLKQNGGGSLVSVNSTYLLQY